MRSGLVIFGNKEMSLMARYYFETTGNFKVVAFTVDDEFFDEDHIEGVPVVPASKIADEFDPKDYQAHVALSYRNMNKNREAKYNLLKSLGFRLANYVCPSVVRHEDLEIGDNCFILECQTIQPQVRIGNNVMLWSGNHIGHGSKIFDHTYVASHVVISGHCQIGRRCFLGVNSTIRDFVEIGDDVLVGMRGLVTRNIKSGSVVYENTSTVLPPDDRKARAIKKNL